MKIKGYIDLHTHGIGRYDTRTSRPEDILKMAELYGKAGTTAFLPTIYSGTITEMRQNMKAVREAMEIQSSESGVRNSELKSKTQNPKSKMDALPSAIILGVHLEGPFLNPARCGALDKESFIKPNLSNLKRLTEDYEGLIKIITVAPEIPGALKAIERCRELGFRVNMGHSDATYKEALEGKEAGATGITHIFNAMRPFHHREPGLAGFGLLDKDIYVEVIADGVHLHPEILKLIFSLKNHNRIILVSDSVKGAKGYGKPVYKSKGILAGSRLNIAASMDVLKNIGINKDVIIFNPETYLTKKIFFDNIFPFH